MKHLKQYCIGCENKNVEFSKEHIFPVWLIKRTNTNNTKIKWHGKYISALGATIPLCYTCNKLLGEKVEAPAKVIFDKLESNQCISDYEAELLVKWMWKFEGMIWHINHPNQVYSDKYTLTKKLTSKIDKVRSDILLAVSLIDKIDPKHGDLPMGIDSVSFKSSLHVSGVFSKIALMTSFSEFKSYIPNNFTTYTLSNKLNKKKKTKVLCPEVGFKDDNEAVQVTKTCSEILTILHENLADQIEKDYSIK